MITVYTRAMCIWCWKAKRLLRSQGLPFVVRDAAEPATRRWVEERTGRRTVPQIFFGEDHVGGYDDLRALCDRGGLRERLG